MYKIYHSDIVKWVEEHSDERFHAVLCDPPYHLTSIVNRFGKDGSAPAKYGTDGVFSRSSGGFMGKDWDGGDVAFRPETWYAISQCLYPGAYLLAFGGTRTFHRLACAIEDAGFIIYDTIAWVYGSGFPKSHNISKAIDKSDGKEGKIIGEKELWGHNAGSGAGSFSKNKYEGQTGIKRTEPILAPATEMAEVWNGYGTALKPAFEPIILARKPIEGSIAKNCVKYGSGGLNIDGCRVEGESVPINKLEEWSGFGEKVKPDYEQEINNKGRWPANFIHDGSEEVLEGFPQTGKSNIRPPTGKPLFAPDNDNRAIKWNDNSVMDTTFRGIEDNGGSAARFFYCAKVSKEEREAGCELMDEKLSGNMMHNSNNTGEVSEGFERFESSRKNNHPTVKPIALTEYLARLILPPSAYAPRRLLVPFSGSGSEMIGAHRAGFEQIAGIEKEDEYCKIAESRLKYWTSIPVQKGLFE